LVAHFWQTERSATLREWGQMHVAGHLYCGLAPLPDGLLNVGMVLPAGAARRAGGSEAAFQHVLAALPAVRHLLDGAERVTPLRGVAPIAARVSRAHGQRFLLVGDAAGFLDPFTGEGVFRALRGAELAAAVAHDALAHDDLSAHALQPYARLRRREFAAKTAVSWIVQVLLASPPVFAYTLRRLAARPRHASLLGAVLGDYHPAAAALRPSFLLSLLRP
jgi:flavin-dependent dehydrogenase